jgi:hypothetical protein
MQSRSSEESREGKAKQSESEETPKVDNGITSNKADHSRSGLSSAFYRSSVTSSHRRGKASQVQPGGLVWFRVVFLLVSSVGVSSLVSSCWSLDLLRLFSVVDGLAPSDRVWVGKRDTYKEGPCFLDDLVLGYISRIFFYKLTTRVKQTSRRRQEVFCSSSFVVRLFFGSLLGLIGFFVFFFIFSPAIAHRVSS